MYIKTKEILRQVSSTTKINILCWVLRYGEITVTKLMEVSGMKRTNISKQINEMKNAGLLVANKQNRFIKYAMSDNYHPEQLKFIKALVNSYHFIDENRNDHEFY